MRGAAGPGGTALLHEAVWGASTGHLGRPWIVCSQPVCPALSSAASCCKHRLQARQ